jgi:hypothetical protein
MIRPMALALALSLLGAGAYAQSAREPDPVILPQKGSGDEVIVGGAVQREVKLPDGDARYDRCVMRITDRESDSPSANPVSIAPEEYCSQRLGMRDRNSAPDRKARSQ